MTTTMTTMTTTTPSAGLAGLRYGRGVAVRSVVCVWLHVVVVVAAATTTRAASGVYSGTAGSDDRLYCVWRARAVDLSLLSKDTR